MKNDPQTYAAIEAAFKKRVKQAREEAGFTQQQVADVLGIKIDRYKKWENRGKSTMPVRFFQNFCQLTHTRAEWFQNGTGQRGELPAPTRKPKAVSN